MVVGGSEDVLVESAHILTTELFIFASERKTGGKKAIFSS
jgi:hypothetical protein